MLPRRDRTAEGCVARVAAGQLVRPSHLFAPPLFSELWRRAVPSGGVSAVVPISGSLMVSATRLGLFLVSPLGGELIDGIHLTDGVCQTPAAHGDRAFVMSNGGTFMSFIVTPPI